MLDCYLGLLVDRADDGRAAVVLVVAPAALLHPAVPQPDGTMLYELVTGHPDRTPGQLVFLADLTVELRAWPIDTWAKVGVDPQTATDAVIAAWHRGHLRGLRLDGLTAEEALAVERPAMTYLRAQLADRLDRRIASVLLQQEPASMNRDRDEQERRPRHHRFLQDNREVLAHESPPPTSGWAVASGSSPSGSSRAGSTTTSVGWRAWKGERGRP